MTHDSEPRLQGVERDGITWFSDPSLEARSGIVVAFSTRQGGASDEPWSSLDLAARTGDDPASVDENRTRLLAALGLDSAQLVTAEQVHGDHVAIVTADDAGRGASTAGGPAPLPATDAMITSEPGVPLLMMFADCVPIVLVARGPVRSVAVVHAGWRGTLGSLPGAAAHALAAHTGCPEDELDAYVGPHIGPCHYEVGADLAEAFEARFALVSHSVSIAAAASRVDLGAAVSHALTSAGLRPQRIAKLGMCTAEHLALFYSYRAEGRTGRHGALAAILPDI